MINCENCDSENVVVDVIDSESFQNEEGEYFYKDILVYTCQDCGYSWDEWSEEYV
jgi:uncharacterized Zn finger protein